MKVARRIGTLGALAALTFAPLATMAVAPSAGAAGSAPSSLAFSQSVVTLTASRDRAMVTTDVELAIQVRPGVSNRVANLQASLNGSGGWRQVAKLRTDRTGLVSYTISSDKPQVFFYRVVVNGSSRYSSATSSTVRIVFDRTNTTLDVNWPRRGLVEVGDQITGVVTPGRGRTAFLERFNFLDEAWDVVDSDAVDSQGAFRVRLDTGAGTTTYRVRVPATRTAKGGVSDEVDLTFSDGTGNFNGTATWPNGNASEDSFVFGRMSGLDDGTEYDVFLQFVDPETGDWTGDGTEGAIVDTEIRNYELYFSGLSGYSGDIRVVLLDNYGQILWSSDPQYVDVS
jgi:hypothetical protein